MTISIIISVYKDVEALSLVINSLLHQTHLADEIIISEDGNSAEMKKYVNTLNEPSIKHLSQIDNGWQKNQALNQSIHASSSKYLIFIDGDCVPYPNFIEGHYALAKDNAVLCGRRSEPGEHFSTLLKTSQLSIQKFVSNYVKNYFKLKQDNIRHYDEGLYLNPNASLLKIIKFFRRKKENHIVGCNFSCWKSDLEKINGFDEDFHLPTTGEDTDIERRMRHFDIKMESCRYSANLIHLYHEKIFNPEISAKTEALMASKKDIFICKNGLRKLN
ncbi:MAG: Glycosyl transferase family 2 [uncultured Sulfurovum sp.]|uniref:Glycosyl transferase family 2 n=1 Tax=uncultured Sulfurovum sp. TaxID=269237 RepID=A0A6S6SZY3_9BACT|nr:MAG: Glycosyl transferase family 2 [uncultured Sulfurovum sp.]